MVAGAVTLIFGCERSAKTESSKLPTPETDPLAQPKSLQQVGAPIEMTRAAIPADNPQTPEKISLGQKLFFDRRLSVDGTVSCSTCHDPALAFTDRKRTSVGVKGGVGQRNAPTILNALYIRRSFGTAGLIRSRNRRHSRLSMPLRWAIPIWMPLWRKSPRSRNTSRHSSAFLGGRSMALICCARSHRTNAHNYPLILRSITSSPATRTRLTLRPSVAGSSSTTRRAATNVMR